MNAALAVPRHPREHDNAVYYGELRGDAILRSRRVAALEPVLFSGTAPAAAWSPFRFA